MADVAIRETIVTPRADGGSVVQMRISDAPRADEPATFQLTILATLPPPKNPAPALGHLQYRALEQVHETAGTTLKALLHELRSRQDGYRDI